jgi:DNA-binding response OmpR family regulator
MVRHSDQATGREELLRKLWQFEDDVPNTRATDDLVKRLRKKLAAQGSRVRVEAVWGYGFRLSLEGGEQGENHRP